MIFFCMENVVPTQLNADAAVCYDGVSEIIRSARESAIAQERLRVGRELREMVGGELQIAILNVEEAIVRLPGGPADVVDLLRSVQGRMESCWTAACECVAGTEPPQAEQQILEAGLPLGGVSSNVSAEAETCCVISGGTDVQAGTVSGEANFSERFLG